MQLALRPWITAGVVTAGTSIIAATPVTGRGPTSRYPRYSSLLRVRICSERSAIPSARASIPSEVAGIFIN
jgi:hypothetical protein